MIVTIIKHYDMTTDYIKINTFNSVSFLIMAHQNLKKPLKANLFSLFATYILYWSYIFRELLICNAAGRCKYPYFSDVAFKNSVFPEFFKTQCTNVHSKYCCKTYILKKKKKLMQDLHVICFTHNIFQGFKYSINSFF